MMLSKEVVRLAIGMAVVVEMLAAVSGACAETPDTTKSTENMRTLNKGLAEPEARPDPAPSTGNRPLIIWWHNAAMSQYSLRSLEKALSNGLVSHVFMLYLHPLDRPLAGQPEVLEAVKLCKKHQVKLIWARTLWPSYEVMTIQRSTIFDANYYAGVIEQIRTEARSLGAEFTGLDAEPYVHFPFLTEFRDGELSPTDYEAMVQALEKAVAEKGQVDFLLPSASLRPRSMFNAARLLGKLTIAEHTYYDVPGKRDDGRPYDIFGAYLNVTKDNPTHRPSPFFTPAEILERQDLWTHKAGLMLYSREDRVEEVAEMLSQITRVQPDTGQK
ncbi:MAG: hypothetical protein V2A79_15675 [Planctomycetota bacterium]